MPNGATGLAALLRSNDDPRDNPAARRIAKDAVRSFFKAIAMKDMVALGRALTDEVVYEMPFSESGSTDPGGYRRFEGRDAVVNFWKGTSDSGISALSPEDVSLSILADGSRLFIEQRGNMTMPDGKAYRNRYVFRFDVREGQVSYVREYINPIISAYAFGRIVADGIKIERL